MILKLLLLAIFAMNLIRGEEDECLEKKEFGKELCIRKLHDIKVMNVERAIIIQGIRCLSWSSWCASDTEKERMKGVDKDYQRLLKDLCPIRDFNGFNQCAEEKEVCIQTLEKEIYSGRMECGLLRTHVKCLRSMLNGCLSDDLEVLIPPVLKELEKSLKKHCESKDTNEEENTNCIEANFDYIFDCFKVDFAKTLTLLEDGNADDNIMKCTMYGKTPKCFVDRIEEKCGLLYTVWAIKKTENFRKEVEDACEVAEAVSFASGSGSGDGCIEDGVRDLCMRDLQNDIESVEEECRVSRRTTCCLKKIVKQCVGDDNDMEEVGEIKYLIKMACQTRKWAKNFVNSLINSGNICVRKRTENCVELAEEAVRKSERVIERNEISMVRNETAMEISENELCKVLSAATNCLRDTEDECLERFTRNKRNLLCEMRSHCPKEIQEELERQRKERQEEETKEGKDEGMPEELPKCVEENADYILKCFDMGSAEALSSSQENYVDLMRCKMHSEVSRCFVERTREKCGNAETQWAVEKISDTQAKILEACQTAEKIDDIAKDPEWIFI